MGDRSETHLAAPHGGNSEVTMGERTDRDELKILRVGVARVAQSLGFLPSDLPGDPITFAYNDLVKAAETDRGWNKLCAAIIDRIEEGVRT